MSVKAMHMFVLYLHAELCVFEQPCGQRLVVHEFVLHSEARWGRGEQKNVGR